MNRIILAVLLVLCWAVAPVSAHEIHLKNGNIIKTDWVKKEDGSVMYKKFGGTIAISSSLVKEIVYTGSAEETDRGQSREHGRRESYAGKDLAGSLAQKMKPRTPVEWANLGTVAVKSDLSMGSGFFISDDGYILTNKHVVRGDKTSDKRLSGELEKFNADLREYKETLDREKDRMNQFEANLRRDRGIVGDMGKKARTVTERDIVASNKAKLQSRTDYLRDWRQKYAKEKDKYLDKKKEHDELSNSHETRKKMFATKNSFEIILADDTRLNASYINSSREHDLALLRVYGYKTPKLKPGSSRGVARGEAVYAIGSPIRMKNSVTSGVLSGFRDNYLQTNAQIYPGNSGGPLVTADGAVIGINTMKMITRKFEGLGFAITIETALKEFDNYLGADAK